MIRFRSLTLEGYGRFGTARTFEFADGLNLIVGANESGKTTLLSALLDALYTSPNSTAQSVRQRIHWGHPDGWRLELMLEHDGTPLRIIKFHPNDDPRKRGEFTLEYNGQPLKGDSAQRAWESLWSLPREVYEATACVRQREMAMLASRKSLSTLQQQLRDSAVATDLEPIFRQIDRQRRELNNRLAQANQRYDQLSQQYQSARQAQAQERAYRQQLEQYRQRLDELKTAIAEQEALFTRWQSARTLSERIGTLRQEARHLEQQIEAIERSASELERITQEIAQQYADFTALPEDFHHTLQGEYQRYQRAHREEQEARKQKEGLLLESQQQVGQSRARVGLAVMGVAVGIAGALLMGTSQLLGGALIGLGALLILVGLMWRPRNQAEQQARRELSEARYQQAQAERKQAETTLIQNLHKAGITEVRPPTPQSNGGDYDLSLPLASAIARFEERWQRYRQLISERNRLQAVLEGLARTQPLHQLRDRYRTLSVEMVGLSQQLEQDPFHKEFATRPAEEFLRLQSQIDQLKSDLQITEREFHRTEGLLESVLLHDDPEALALQLQSVQNERDYLQSRLELITTARSLLEEANRRYLDNLSPQLQPRIECYLPHLTGNRYRHIEIGSDLSLKVFHAERGESLPLDENDPAWSAGTLDQLFFACRLGLSDALSGDKRVPLLLDDPLVHSDEARLKSALALIQQVAEQTQVLYFTCRAVPLNGAHRIELE